MKLQTKLSRVTIVICAIAILFAAASGYMINSMRNTAQSMYEHPYTVTNTARAMRSRLLDMKQFVGIFLTRSFESEEKARELFDEATRCRMKRSLPSGKAIWGLRRT